MHQEFMYVLLYLNVVASFVSFCIMLDYKGDNKGLYVFFIASCITLGTLIAWWSDSYTQLKIEIANKTITKSENIDLLILNSEIINLNDRFKRSFNEQVTIKYRPAQFSKGLFWQQSIISCENAE